MPAMQTLTNHPTTDSMQKEEPLCPVFGTCGGCSYQDITYESELKVKEEMLRIFLQEAIGLSPAVFKDIVRSPRYYHYRHRLDLTFRKTRAGDFLIGFIAENRHKVLELEACPIAMAAVSDFLPALKKEAMARLPLNYDTANLVVRTGDDGRVRWGGIGRRSLRLKEEDYLWTEIEGKKIYFDLETFFQANLSILPVLIQTVRKLLALDRDTVFLDLYSGVGLFGLCLAGESGPVVMMEDYPASVQLAHYNIMRHGLQAATEICDRRVEEGLPEILAKYRGRKMKVMIDPPRNGVKAGALEALAAQAKTGILEKLLYLSCYPPALARDLKQLCAAGWKVMSLTPLDFFPRTKHLEVLAELGPGI